LTYSALPLVCHWWNTIVRTLSTRYLLGSNDKLKLIGQKSNHPKLFTSGDCRLSLQRSSPVRIYCLPISLCVSNPDIYVGMDTDFHRRFLLEGFRVRYSSATEWHLGSPLTVRGWLKRNLYYAPSLLKSTSKHPLYSLSRINPLHTVSAWKKSDAHGSDLILVVILGILSNISLALAALLIHHSREVPVRPAHGSRRIDPVNADELKEGT